MTPKEIYDLIVLGVAWRFPRVFEALGEKIKTGPLTEASVVDYLRFWAEIYRKAGRGEDVKKVEPTFPVMNFNIMVAQIIEHGIFTDDEWQQCRMAMVKEYMQIALDEKRAGKHKLLPASVEMYTSRSSLTPELFDGRQMTEAEVKFEQWFFANYDIKDWCERHGIQYDESFSRLLERAYHRKPFPRIGS